MSDHEEIAARSLTDVGVHSRLRIGGITVRERRRRPSGEPRHRIGARDGTAKLWIGLAIITGGLAVLAVAIDGIAGALVNLDEAILEWAADLRSRSLTPLMEALNSLGSEWTTRLIRWAMLAVLVAYFRWRHLAVGLGAIFLTEFLVRRLAEGVNRLPIADSVATATEAPFPSLPVAALTITLVVAGYSLFIQGRIRRGWFIVSSVVVVLLGISRVYLGIEHPTDVVVGAVLGGIVGVGALRLFVPASVFPVSYSRGSKAHLQLLPRRQQAIRAALESQMLDQGSPEGRAVRTAVHDELGCDVLGCELLDVTPFGLDGSAGSTPLRIRVAGDAEASLFGKLYATNHLRSDRWYKAFRSVAYGSLEDEVPFGSVRRLVEYEDYMLRVMADAGLPVPQPLGFVEVRRDQEYLLVTEFIDGAVELGKADLTEAMMHNALGLVRRLWDAGLAHRDIKPANLLVRGDEVYLIDTAFATLHPTPWRQAVDLANMMLLLAERTDAGTVYEHAIAHFDPGDVAEAFAATRGVTIPRQLREALRERSERDGVDLIEEFRRLAPECPPIHIQRWSARRVATSAVLLGGGAAFATLLIENLNAANFF